MKMDAICHQCAHFQIQINHHVSKIHILARNCQAVKQDFFNRNETCAQVPIVEFPIDCATTTTTKLDLKYARISA